MPVVEIVTTKSRVSKNVICASNIVRSVLITMLGRLLLTMLQRLAGD